jgi:peptidoglycan/LPS O-acetylase OafA/YrhL
MMGIASRTTIGQVQEKVPAPTSHHAFRPDIEGMRAIAILMVVAFHVGIPGFNGGFAGVDVFFVLSGYLITGLLLKELDQTGSISLKAFYARRIRRLLPAATLMVIVTLGVSFWLLSPLESAVNARTGLATSLYFSNYSLMQTAGNYFRADVATSPFLHTWSLAVEEQFYFVWPLLLIAAGKIRNRKWLVYVLASLTAVSLGLCIWLMPMRPVAAFYASPARAWEFGLGALAWFVAPRIGRMSAVLGVAGLLLIAISTLLLRPESAFPGPYALVPVVGTAAVLIARGNGVQVVLGNRVMQYLGKISYSWYLWHWPVLVLVAAAVPGLTMPGRIACVLFALAFAHAAHVLIENPVRFSGRLTKRPSRTFALAVILIALGVIASFAVERGAHNVIAASPDHSEYVRASNDFPQTVTDGCMAGARLRPCRYGDTLSATTVVVFGDSHAAQWAPAFIDVATQQKWQVVFLVKNGCPAAVVPMKRNGWTYRECDDFRAQAIREMERIRPALVVVSSYQAYVSRAQRQGWRGDPLDIWRNGHEKLFASLSHLATPMVLLQDTPRPLMDIPTCMSRRLHNRFFRDIQCDIPRGQAFDSVAVTAVERALAKNEKIARIDLTDRLCSTTSCPALIDQQIVYRDNSHITAEFAGRLAPVLAARLVPLVN